MEGKESPRITRIDADGRGKENKKELKMNDRIDYKTGSCKTQNIITGLSRPVRFFVQSLLAFFIQINLRNPWTLKTYLTARCTCCRELTFLAPVC